MGGARPQCKRPVCLDRQLTLVPWFVKYPSQVLKIVPIWYITVYNVFPKDMIRYRCRGQHQTCLHVLSHKELFS
jgi:hypothetical protein